MNRLLPESHTMQWRGNKSTSASHHQAPMMNDPDPRSSNTWWLRQRISGRAARDLTDHDDAVSGLEQIQADFDRKLGSVLAQPHGLADLFPAI